MDWEKIIDYSDRNVDYLKKAVEGIYEVFLQTERFVNSRYLYLEDKLPDQIFFIDAQELEQMYPNLDAKAREREIAKEKRQCL